MSVNKVILLGNVGKDPEVKYLDNNKVVANFTLATNEYYKDKNGNRAEQTEWHNIELWDELARLTEKYVKKGNQLYIEGKIRTNSWTDKETGQEKSSKYIRVSQMTFIGTGNEKRQDSNNAPGNTVAENMADDTAATDDLPF